MKEKYIYPACFDPSSNSGYSVTFPDLPGCFTEGSTLDEAYKMAQDALKLHLYCLEKEGDVLPIPTSPNAIKVENGGFVSLVDVWMPGIRRSAQLKSIKKTLTIPKWLNDIAEHEGVNFSYILQRALKDYLKQHSEDYVDHDDF